MERIHRRSLPHWYVPGAAHFVTYRLAGTLPVHVIRELKEKKSRLLREKADRPTTELKQHVHSLLFAAYDKYLDDVSDIDWLRDSRIASLVRENLYHHDEDKYCLHAYCIMPNHVHVLLTPSPSKAGSESSREDVDTGERPDKLSPLSKIMHGLKSFTANEANGVLNRSGTFWQAESYDHWVRDDEELERIADYIRANPVEAGLVQRPEDWHWSSCHDRYLLDGDTSAWLP